ncbi:hypothetical protein JD844_033978 [Phrynosoma platyrhinos]|uniref:Rho GTPase activating protein 45 n=1 Tax=Phrynosoma platyrhinos TaxID=52577 RepID=A0ABQ7T7X9_PHRPL|nr:hypothetical protein JD844_033978 [Phrynosoma platyrhinos]
MATYRTCIADANTQRQELEDTKVTSLRQLHEVVKQSDQVIKSTLCESSKLYDPGQQYASHVKRLQREDEPETQYDFEPYVSQNNCRARKGSYSASEFAQAGSLEAASKDGATHIERRGEFPPKYQPLPSNGSLSPGDDADGNSPLFQQTAQTHRLRKLRTPSKCRECNSYVYFQGAECEECYLACHKKCLETLAIQCGHKKLQGKLQLFGQDFLQASRISPDGIPFIVKKCVLEIEKRAMKTKGIYRVNGVKTRVEKLCQAFENGKELVELSQASPHDISNVLKLYLRQLPEPILPFRMYNSLMGLAKESLQGGSEGGKATKSVAEMVDKGAETEKAVLVLVSKLRELLKELPPENLATIKFIVQHLKRIVEVEQENKMTSGNLGIVFGPTLMRPRPIEATISLSSLVDYPHQARIIEALIIFYSAIFETDRTFADGLEEAAKEEEEEEEEEPIGNQEDACVQPHDGVPYHLPTPDQAEAALHEESYGESRARFIDSDSDLEDGTEPGIEGDLQTVMAQHSESSGDEETPSADEATEEGTQSWRCSVGQSDSEDVLLPPNHPSPGEEDAVFGKEDEVAAGGGMLGGCNTNQSNNTSFSHLCFDCKMLGQ